MGLLAEFTQDRGTLEGRYLARVRRMIAAKYSTADVRNRTLRYGFQRALNIH